jgi:2-polyprenyl-3-methyl-5-hydroxy-6-metoxy-1,4-benzoquinol methylase
MPSADAGQGRRVCPACGSTAGWRRSRAAKHGFLRCAACGSLFLADPPPAGHAEDLYRDQSYFANPEFGSGDDAGFHGYLDYLADRPHIEEKFGRVLARIERSIPPGRLLDVGAGPGFMLTAARARGWSPEGLDLNPWAVDYGRRELGVELREGTLEEAGHDGGFDAVTLMDVIEHVADPDPLLASAAAALREGGVLAVLTPDAGSPVSRALGSRWPEAQRTPEHLVLFSRRGLEAALRRHGLEPLGSHSIGKTSSVATLLADVAPIAPGVLGPAQRAVSAWRLGRCTFELDPRTKFVAYARRPG